MHEELEGCEECTQGAGDGGGHGCSGSEQTQGGAKLDGSTERGRCRGPGRTAALQASGWGRTWQAYEVGGRRRENAGRTQNRRSILLSGWYHTGTGKRRSAGQRKGGGWGDDGLRHVLRQARGTSYEYRQSRWSLGCDALTRPWVGRCVRCACTCQQVPRMARARHVPGAAPNRRRAPQKLPAGLMGLPLLRQPDRLRLWQGERHEGMVGSSSCAAVACAAPSISSPRASACASSSSEPCKHIGQSIDQLINQVDPID